MIDVIIPAFNAHKTIDRTLKSVAKQINRNNLKVYIIDDGSDYDYSDVIIKYSSKLIIEQISIANSGPGYARQKGLDVSNNEYIFFLDADDTLYDKYSLVSLLDAIEDADIVQGNFVEKAENGKKILSPQYCYLHGKLFRRSVIKKYNLVFDTTKKNSGDIYEDSSFNQLYLLCCGKEKTIDRVVYVYEYTPTSLTKTSIDSEVNLHNFIDSMNWLTNEIKKRNIMKKYDLAWYYCVMCFHCYFHYLSSPDTLSFVFNDMKDIKKIYMDNKNELSYEDELAIYKSFEISVIPTITFYDFLDKCKG